jgi:hypothetical protein
MKIIFVLISILIISLAGGSNESLNIINSSEILNKFKNNEDVNYDAKLIDGNLLFNNSLNNKSSPIHFNITIENSTIVGDVNLSYTKFNKVSFFNSTFTGSIIAKNSFFNDANFSFCKIYDKVDFTRSRFQSSAKFDETNINKSAIFLSCEFHSLADFKGTNFKDIADFRKVKFFNDLDFNEIIVKRDAYFSESVFSGNSTFSKVNFKGRTSFVDCIFSEKVYFRVVTFNLASDFRNVCFKKGATFSSCEFNEDCAMQGWNASGPIGINHAIFGEDAKFQDSNFFNYTCCYCEFKRGCDFSNSTFKGDANFKFSKFGGDPDFSDVIFGKTVDLSNCIFNNTLRLKRSNFTGSVNLMDSVFHGDVFAEDAIFNGILSMNRTQYSCLYVRWSNLKKGILYNETAYHSLIKNFKNLGLFSDANECYYAFMSEVGTQTAQQSISVHSLFYFFIYSISRSLYGFGTKPEYPLIWSGILIFVFAFYWYYKYRSVTTGSIFDRYGVVESKKGVTVTVDMQSEFTRLLDAIKLSLNIFLSGTKLFFDPPEIPKRLTGSRIWMKRIYLVERTLGAGFFFLFFFAISKMLLSY